MRTLISDSASTPTHLAATKGQIHCVNCLVQHGATLSLLNARGDDILGAAKRQGHPVAVHKAIDGKVKCPLFVSCRFEGVSLFSLDFHPDSWLHGLDKEITLK
jgi:hypothetical protein